MDINRAAVARIAEWMLQSLTSERFLYQEDAVTKITDQFGAEYVYENENGNLAIRKDVLAAFRKLTQESVVWDREDKCWRARNKQDGPGRQQD